jgi:transcriptional regulator with XRE-family HTH domain
MILQLFSERLKDARERIPLTQDEIALKTGIPKRSYCAYEAGDIAPSAKLLKALALMGMDIGYLLTGSRAAAVSPTLSPRQRALLDNYEHAPEDGKKIIEGTASMAAQSMMKKAG